MKRYLIFAFLLALGVPGTASTEALTCGTKVIQMGDSADQVRAYCGKPASIHKEAKLFKNGGKLGERCFHGSVNVEKWNYQRAFGRANKVVTIVEGQVADASSGATGPKREWRSPCT
jgi:hypothetical protein